MKKSVEFSVGKKESTDREGGWGEKGEKEKKKKKRHNGHAPSIRNIPCAISHPLRLLQRPVSVEYKLCI